MLQNCRHCTTRFEITDEDLTFYDRVSPVFNGNKYAIPPPTLCPDCRQQNRLAFRIDRSLYNRKSSLSGREIVSIYSPDKAVTVYDQEEWWSDTWDALQYGKTYDFSKSFFEQYKELFREVPRVALYNLDPHNSVYCNNALHSKNCYLLFASNTNEEMLYSYWSYNSSSSVDCSYIYDSQLCYQSVNLKNCYETYFSQLCSFAVDAYFCYNCSNINNCIGCTNLHNTSYHIFNQPCTKAEFEKAKQELLSGSWKNIDAVARRYAAAVPNVIRKPMNGSNNEESTGDYLSQTKSCEACFDLDQSEDCKFMVQGRKNKDCYDGSYNVMAELCYNNLSSADHVYHNLFSCYVWNCSDVFYSDSCYYSKNLFGCVGLRNKQYCILNQQYTKQEYEKLVPKIIEQMQKNILQPFTRQDAPDIVSKKEEIPIPGLIKEKPAEVHEWGEFFPSSLSPFGYNETVAMEYFPLTREQVLSFPSLKGRGQGEGDVRASSPPPNLLPSAGGTTALAHGIIFNWSDYELPKPDVKKIIPAAKLPDNIRDIPDDILNWAVECEITKKPYRIIKQELEFYREHNLPVPSRHPDQRDRDRMSLRNPRKLWERQCHCIVRKHQHDTLPKRSLSDHIKPDTGQCLNRFQSTYAPDSHAIVYCEACYRNEVF